MRYVFRWKEYQEEVRSSWAYTEDDVWKWAIQWLRPATMTDDVEAEKFIREHGEVIEMIDDECV